jgi:uncharacterized membrane protein YfcA
MQNYFFLILVGFIAGVINTISGGGSLITLPMLIFMGLPSSIANGTNRIAILIQNIFSTAGFKSKNINPFPFGLWLGASALLGSVIGAYLGAIYFKDEIFNKILGAVMILIVIYMIFKPKISEYHLKEKTKGKHFYLQLFVFFFIGIYGGFIQAGTGIFIILALHGISKIKLVKTNAIKAIVVIFYTISALVIYAYNDKIDYKIGFIMAVGNALGAWFASRWSVNKGDNIVRWFMIVMVTFMALKLWFPQWFW